MALFFYREDPILHNYTDSTGKNSWGVIFTIGRNPKTGKPIQKSFTVHGTRKDAEAFRAKMAHQLTTGAYVPLERQSFEDFCNRWLEDKKMAIKPSTYRDYEWKLRVHIIPALGHYELDKLHPQHIQAFYTALLQNGLSATSIRAIHRLLHQILKKARTWGLIQNNPTESVELPREKDFEAKTWTMDEMLQFLEAAKEDRYFIAFHLACFTGMRQGEILGLRWQDVDFENKRLYVRQALISTKGQGYILADVKTESSRRAIAVSEETIELLHSHRAKQAQERLRKGPEWQDFDLVVATQNGTPVSPRNLMRSFYRIMEKANVPRIRFHDIRHTHATHLLQLGNDLKITSARLGHSSINITADLYSHVTADMQEVAVSLLEEAVKKKRKTP